MVFIVFSGKFCWTMERVDLVLMNVYYISAHATLGFEVTSFPILSDFFLPFGSLYPLALFLLSLFHLLSLIRVNGNAKIIIDRNHRVSKLILYDTFQSRNWSHAIERFDD